MENYSLRADRNARQLAKERYIRRMTKEEKKAIYGDIRQEAWVYEEKTKQETRQDLV